MPQIDDFTAMREWDLGAAVLKDAMASVRWPATGDFSSLVMGTGDADVAAGNALANLQTMEENLLHTATTATNRAFLKDFQQLMACFATWYVSGSDGGYANLATALAARHYRLPYMLATAWAAVNQGGSIGAAYLCPYQDIPLYQAVRGMAARLIAALPSDLLYARMALDCNEAIGAQVLSVVLGVTYSDDTAGTETTAVTNGSVDGTRFEVAALPITGIGVSSGHAVIPMASTAGMVAGQKILVRDGSWPSALTSDLAATGTVLTVENSNPFSPGDAIHLWDDLTGDENATILNVVHETNTITLAAGTTGNFTQANHAKIRKATPADFGWSEVVEILSVQANVSITLTGNLVNSFSSDGYVQRLIKTITSMTTTGGSGGDCVDLKAVPDRYNYGALNSSSSSSSSRSWSSSSSSTSTSTSSSSSSSLSSSSSSESSSSSSSLSSSSSSTSSSSSSTA